MGIITEYLIRPRLISILAIIGISSFLRVWGQEKNIVLNSPDGLLGISFRTLENRQNDANSPITDRLVYEVKYKGNQVMNPSSMGLELDGSRALGENIRILTHQFSEGVDNYTMLAGRTASVSEPYNSVVLEVVEERFGSRKMNIEARAYNDAVAFRYIVPEQPTLIEYRLKAEMTEYKLPKDAMSYALVLPHFRTGYESEYHKVPVTGLSNQGGVSSYYLVGMPILFDISGVGWVAITEADIEGNAATYLRNPTGSWAGHWFESVVSPNLREQEMAVISPLPHKTAWRVIMVHSEPTHFMVSNTLTNLNPACRIIDTSWIQSGKSSWDWWNGSLNRDGEQAYTTETMKYYVDFAAESGFEFMTIDAGWSELDITVCRNNVDIPEVVAYAKTKGVKVFIWVHGSSVWRQMDEAFPLYEKWGVAGLKIDFILRDDQAGIDFYYKVAEKAAKHRLMVDFHGCTKPWGLQRTYPNVVGFEGLLGMENSLVGVRDNPENRLVAPFTRMIGGLMDYTPGGFENVTRENFVARHNKPMVMGTRAHHLAIYVVYESPFHMVSDWPERYKNEPSFEWIKKVPSNWDKSVAVNGYPGEYVTIARKRGDDWYLGAMTNWTAREFEIPLEFLDSGNYIAEVYADTPDADKFPKKINIRTIKVTPNNKFKISMVSGGGVAVHFKKVK